MNASVGYAQGAQRGMQLANERCQVLGKQVEQVCKSMLQEDDLCLQIMRTFKHHLAGVCMPLNVRNVSRSIN
jgi:hypothetical protein